jgi:hypothetical protein
VVEEINMINTPLFYETENGELINLNFVRHTEKTCSFSGKESIILHMLGSMYNFEYKISLKEYQKLKKFIKLHESTKK